MNILAQKIGVDKKETRIYILMFLHNNLQHNTAADIVKVRKSTKSHVSTSLKDLEGKGMVERIRTYPKCRCMSEENQGVKKMKEENFKPQMPDIMEVIFDVGYLIFDLVAAIIISFGCYTPVTLRG